MKVNGQIVIYIKQKISITRSNSIQRNFYLIDNIECLFYLGFIFINVC